jgi:hypothetical protein
LETPNSIVAVFDDHVAAEAAVKKLGDAGFDIKNISVVGKGCARRRLTLRSIPSR